MADDRCVIRGSRIRDARERINMSQGELARLLSMDHAGLSRIERGVNDMMAATAEKIAGALGITMDQLFAHHPLGEGKSEVDDPYPNRARVRLLPEFQRASHAVQRYFLELTLGDMTYFDWCDELRRAQRLHANGALFPLTPIDPPDVADEVASARGKRKASK